MGTSALPSIRARAAARPNSNRRPTSSGWVGCWRDCTRSGRAARFDERGTLDRATLIRAAPSRAVLASPLLPTTQLDRYARAIERLDALIAECFAAVGPLQHLRLHGDCHAGNVLWTDAGPHFVDLDDARMGPAVQDLWMLATGEQRWTRCSKAMASSATSTGANWR